MLPTEIPANDAGISFGQIIETAGRDAVEGASMTDTGGLSDTHIGLAHGNGGRLMRELIERLFARHLANPHLDVTCDAVPVPLDAGHD